jgi:hypothetical protein
MKYANKYKKMKAIDVNLQLPPSLIYASNNEHEIRIPRSEYFKVEYHATERGRGIKFP